MRSFFARRLILACSLTAFAAATLVAPGVARAGITTKHCEGVSIEANGATLQKKAQELWNKEFNNVALQGACELKGTPPAPTVKYTGTGSGPGLESWGGGKGAGTGKFGPKNAFVGTDEPPNLEQKEQIEKEGSGKLLTVPVVQAAVAIIVHLPKGCVVKDKVAPGRLLLSNATLEKIFHGTLTSWTAIKDAKEKLKGKKGACNQPIKRVVRLEGSGSTSIFKKYLNLQEGNEFEVEGSKTTWKKLAESTSNTVWPEEKADPVLKGKGGGGVVAEVAAKESTIAYANLADARATFGAPTAEMFWAELENGSVKKGKKTIATYAEPANNGETTTKGSANCTETLYTDGKNKFPPASAENVWNEVTTSLTEPHYTICGFSYDLSLTKFEGAGKGEAATDESTRTALDYLEFALTGGQKLLEGNDYLGLPENASGHVLKIAKEGLGKVSFS
jgi:ABC-type phosphate transport system substrate-binding protein